MQYLSMAGPSTERSSNMIVSSCCGKQRHALPGREKIMLRCSHPSRIWKSGFHAPQQALQHVRVSGVVAVAVQFRAAMALRKSRQLDNNHVGSALTGHENKRTEVRGRRHTSSQEMCPSNTSGVQNIMLRRFQKDPCQTCLASAWYLRTYRVAWNEYPESHGVEFRSAVNSLPSEKNETDGGLSPLSRAAAQSALCRPSISFQTKRQAPACPANRPAFSLEPGRSR